MKQRLRIKNKGKGRVLLSTEKRRQCDDRIEQRAMESEEEAT